METNLLSKSIPDRFHHLFKVISHDRFLKIQGIGKEIPFFICPYHPSEANPMSDAIGSLIKKLTQTNIAVLNINLYLIAVEILQNRGIWEKILEKEPSIDKSELKELLQGVLNIETIFTPKIEEIMNENQFDVMFITGIGAVFPYIRSHTILNNLQSKIQEKPTILFFPGSYSQNSSSGSSLDLFDKLHDDKYYRAFNIFDYDV